MFCSTLFLDPAVRPEGELDSRKNHDSIVHMKSKVVAWSGDSIVPFFWVELQFVNWQVRNYL